MVAISGFGVWVMLRSVKADWTLSRSLRIGEAAQQKRNRRTLLVSYPLFMALGGGIGALADRTDRVGGSIGGLFIGMFAWVPAAWIFAFEIARRRRLRQAAPRAAAPDQS